MTQTQTIKKHSLPQIHNIGEKIISVLQQPLFTFTFSLPELKKTEPQKEVKTDVPKMIMKKREYRPTSVNSKVKPSTPSSIPKRTIKSMVFTPNHNREDFGKIQFVLRACDRHSGRTFTEVLHIEPAKNGSRLISTDGKRLHVTEIKTRIKPGDYKPLVTKDLIKLGTPVPNVNFPNWERVVPVDVTKRGCINLVNARLNEIDRISNSFTKMSGEKVNPKYLSDLRNKSWVIYCQKEKQKALILKEYNASETFAVIMPLAA